jgi:hypothetical protein
VYIFGQFSNGSVTLTKSVKWIIQSDCEIVKKKPVIGDKSFFVFEIKMIENLVKIASTLLSYR